jgi:hypothetical protein
MADLNSTACVNCGRDEDSVPLVQWRYQQRAFWLCADCLPQMIHKRSVIMQKLSGAVEPAPAPSNELELRAA